MQPVASSPRTNVRGYEPDFLAAAFLPAYGGLGGGEPTSRIVYRVDPVVGRPSVVGV